MDLLCKSMYCFLYNSNTGLKWVNTGFSTMIQKQNCFTASKVTIVVHIFLPSNQTEDCKELQGYMKSMLEHFQHPLFTLDCLAEKESKGI